MSYKTYTEQELQAAMEVHAQALAERAMETLGTYALNNPTPKSAKEIAKLSMTLLLDVGNETQKLLPDADFKTIHEAASELSLATFEVFMEMVVKEKRQDKKEQKGSE